MMETRNISLGGLLFHLELPAFERLNRYLASLKRVLTGTLGEEEILQEVEHRLAELLHEALAGADRAVTLADVDRVCSQLGEPQEFAGSDDPESDGPGDRMNPSRRRWFRDPDDRMVAGVASGIAYRFGVDPVVIRALFVALVAFTGTGVIIYLVLAAIMPVAKTTADRLAMKGDTVTLASIMAAVESSMQGATSNMSNSGENMARRWSRFVSTTLPDFLRALARGLGYATIGVLVFMLLAAGTLFISTLLGISAIW